MSEWPSKEKQSEKKLADLIREHHWKQPSSEQREKSLSERERNKRKIVTLWTMGFDLYFRGEIVCMRNLSIPSRIIDTKRKGSRRAERRERESG
jgi:hypothetical protein